MIQNERLSGILLHPTSFPSPYGIGDLGKEAYAFVDFLKEAGQRLWQILPLTHTGYGDSPYQSFSAFAGQPLLISPEHLIRMGFLKEEELLDCPVGNPEHIDYGAIIPWKEQILSLACRRFAAKKETDRELENSFRTFCEEQHFWLSDYALFMACKKVHGGVSWLEWKEEYRRPAREFKEELFRTLSDDIEYYKFLQFIFFREWKELKLYANKNEIKIIGDIPIFVSMDSADVWANQHLFQLDAKGFPTCVAGVPPDYFSATGQLWGNPLYSWDAHRNENFAWWVSRIRTQLSNLDILRIDHFRGFEAYWSIPCGEETAVNGQWIKAPGYELFNAVRNSLGNDLPIIAEDLGIITEQVNALREHFGFPGMKVLQFAFDSVGESDYLPHRYQNPLCVCYTGTHDNDTSLGWYETLSQECKDKVLRYTNNSDKERLSFDFMRLASGSIAACAIFPLQDVLGLGSAGRMNTPGVPSGNWNWRYKKDALLPSLAKELKDMTILYGRY